MRGSTRLRSNGNSCAAKWCSLISGHGFVRFLMANLSFIKRTGFTSDGRPGPSAKITIVRSDIETKQQKKSQKEAISDRLGEFAFRMDVGHAKFHLSVEAHGFPKQEKEVEVAGDERADISVVLKK